MGHVEGERHVRVHGMGACLCAAGADLLLGGGSRDEVARGAAGLRQLLHHAAGDPHAALVVEALRYGHAVAEALEAHAEGDGVAHGHELLHALGLHAQIDHERRERRDVLALIGLDKVDGLAAHHTAQHAACRMHVHAHAGQNGRVHPAERGHRQKALIGDVGDHEADLVHMGREHAARAARVARQGGMDRAHHVGVDGRGHAGQPLAHEGRHGLLAARGRRGAEQPCEEPLVFWGHGSSFPHARSGWAPDAATSTLAWRGGWAWARGSRAPSGPRPGHRGHACA